MWPALRAVEQLKFRSAARKPGGAQGDDAAPPAPPSKQEMSNAELCALLDEIVAEKLPAGALKPTDKVVVVGDFNNEFVDAGVLSTAGIKVAGASGLTAVSNSIDKYHKDEPTYADPDRGYVTAFYADAAAAESTLVDQMLERKGWRAGDSCLAGPAPQLRVTSGVVPPEGESRELLPASDHSPMSYELEEDADGARTTFRVGVYNVCWEIWEPDLATKLDKGTAPTGRILVPLAGKCTANVLGVIVSMLATHELLCLQEVPRPKAGSTPEELPEKWEAWGRFQAALDALETHGYVYTEHAFAGLVTIYSKAKFRPAPSPSYYEGQTEESKPPGSRPYQVLTLLDASSDQPYHIFHLHCGNRFRPKFLEKKFVKPPEDAK